MAYCGRTCRSLNQVDYSCNIKAPVVDGCGCEMGTYMNEHQQCVNITNCPCYDQENIIQPEETVTKDGVTWYAIGDPAEWIKLSEVSAQWPFYPANVALKSFHTRFCSLVLLNEAITC